MNKYIIVESADVGSLQNLVNEKMDVGYKPFGNIVVFSVADPCSTSMWFLQSMLLSEV